MKDPKLSAESEETKKVAEALGVDLSDDDDNKKADKESKSDKKTDTEDGEKENRTVESDKSKEDDKVDYKKMYADSVREHQQKYKPLEDKIKSIEQLSGKNIDDLVKEFQGKKEDQEKEEKEKEKKDASSGEEEVNKKISSLEEKISSIADKVQFQEEKDAVIARETVDAFKEKYGLSDDDYKDKYSSLLKGIKDMRKPNGDPYTLEEGLEMAYIFVNKDSIDDVIDKKMKIKQKEQELAFSPVSSKESYQEKGETYSNLQKDIAMKMGTDLTEEE